MNEKILLMDEVKYKIWTPKKEVEEFEPIVLNHIEDIFGEKCKYFSKKKIKTLANKRSIPDGFVVDFKNKRWYILELKLLCEDAIRRIGNQIIDYKNAVKRIQTRKEIYDAIGDNSVYKVIFDKNPEIVVIVNSLDGEKGQQFIEKVKGADRNAKIIEFKTYAREHVDPSKVHVHLFEPLYKFKEEIYVESKLKDRVKRGKGLPQKAYYIPILESLIELGGKGTLKEVEEKVEKKMKKILTPLDYETLSDGKTIRWRNRTEWARNDLVNKFGYLKKDSPWGIWEISEKGQRYYKENKEEWNRKYMQK